MDYFFQVKGSLKDHTTPAIYGGIRNVHLSEDMVEGEKTEAAIFMG
jgi:hypothetical protein